MDAGVIAKFANRLDGALAEGLLSDDDSALMIAEGSSHYLGCAGRAAVDQDGKRGFSSQAAVFGRKRPVVPLRIPLIEDDAGIDELTGYLHCRPDEAAGVIPEI
jgi:hypothetical protein